MRNDQWYESLLYRSTRLEAANQMTYIIMCQVSGGVSGTRRAPLRSDGQVRTFSDESAAQAEASRLNFEINGPYSKTPGYAVYWVMKDRRETKEQK